VNLKCHPPECAAVRALQRGAIVIGEDGVKNNLPLQDAYLLAIKRENAPVTIYLRNGFQLRGHVRGFDNFTIILEYDNKPHLVYKHAVSTVSPQAPVQFSGSEIGGGSRQNAAVDSEPAISVDGPLKTPVPQ
jgi:host factor-I protein